MPAVKLLYRGHMYRLARTRDDIAWERVAELSKQIYEAATNKSLASVQKRDHVSSIVTDLKENLKFLGLYSPAI